MLFGLDKLAGGLNLLSLKRLLTAWHILVPLQNEEPAHVIVVGAALDILNVDGQDPYDAFVVTTWIWSAIDLGPLYEVSLPSGLCFEVQTSL